MLKARQPIRWNSSAGADMTPNAHCIFGTGEAVSGFEFAFVRVKSYDSE